MQLEPEAKYFDFWENIYLFFILRERERARAHEHMQEMRGAEGEGERNPKRTLC